MNILGIFAHPDDETFGPGGTFALLTESGCDVYLWCATRGEAGSIGQSKEFGPEGLAAVRTQELKRAAQVLGMHPPVIMDYPDGGLAGQDPKPLRADIIKIVRQVQPRLVITFHPNGLSGHEDHKTVTRQVLEAVPLAAEACCLELGAPHQVDRVLGYCFVESLTKKITWRTVQGVADGEVDVFADTRKFIAAKLKAVEAHQTQKPFIDDLSERLGGLDEHWAREGFQVLLGKPFERVPADNVLEGLS